MESVDASVMEYVLKLKKVEVASCEAISQAREFSGELNAWLDRKKEEEKEVKE